MNSWFAALLLSSSAMAAPVAGPPIPTGPPREVPLPPPLLTVKVVAPLGTQVTFQPESPDERTFHVPASVGYRPGYIYRLKLTNLPGMGRQAIYPSIEVRGSLRMPANKAAKHALALTVTTDDIQKLIDGALITRVVYLENPDQAAAVAAQPDEPLEVTAASVPEALSEARLQGRVMAIIRMGPRAFDQPDELIQIGRQAIAGTVQYPTDGPLPPPALPPYLPTITVPFFDPLLGPKQSTYECLRDGGDEPPLMGIGPDGKLHGLEPADTALEFTTPEGKRRVVPSCPTCICVPRFVAIRVEEYSAQMVKDVPIDTQSNQLGPVASSMPKPPHATINRVPPVSVKTRVGPAENVGQKNPQILESLVGRPQVTAKVLPPAETVQVTEPDEINAYPVCKPLTLFKWYEPKEPAQGDIVTFYLRYTNTSTQTVTDVAVVDSLTARLEYIPESAQTDRPATFTFTPNEAGSAVLRWEVEGPLLPGTGGVVSFKARIR